MKLGVQWTQSFVASIGEVYDETILSKWTRYCEVVKFRCHLRRFHCIYVFLSISGVVETGLFVGMAKKAYFGQADGSVMIREAKP